LHETFFLCIYDLSPALPLKGREKFVEDIEDFILSLKFVLKINFSILAVIPPPLQGEGRGEVN
jgi:hypothetical protein